MKISNQNLTLNTFFIALSKAKYNVLMLDYDGTLAPFQVDRMAAFPYPEVNYLLDILINKKKNKVVIISGRTIDELLKLFDLAKGLEIWGSHGLERLTVDNKYELFKFDKTQITGLEKAKKLIEKLKLMKQCEIKPGAIAIHWRGLDTNIEASICNSIYQPFISISNDHKLKLFNFDGGVELRCPDRNKDYAVNQILSTLPPDAVSAYLGDDLTDEYAFKAIKRRGLAVRVSAKRQPTFADVCLVPPAELIDFLKRWIDATH